jgi:D-amino-acid oxidase
MGKNVAIVGQGIIGLLTAAEALRRGFSVEVFADRDILATTSARAPANFKPSSVFYSELTHQLVEQSWIEWEKYLHDYGPNTGIRLHTHWEAMSTPRDPAPYLSVVKNVCHIEFPDVPGGYRFAWRYQTFFIDMSVFLPWLREHLKSGGARFCRKEFRTIEEVAALQADVIVNATGFGAKSLTHDSKLIPKKGQVATIKALPQMDWSISADGFFVFPRSCDAVLGATVESGDETENTDSNVIELLVRANKRVLPTLTMESIRATMAGIRPYRTDGPRIEFERVAGKQILHNYGHGGSGVTLGAGSAKFAVDLI